MRIAVWVIQERSSTTVLQDIAVQVAIITGSGQGVGAAAAQLFAQHGAKVVVTDIDAGKSEQVTYRAHCKVLVWCESPNSCRSRLASGTREERQ